MAVAAVASVVVDAAARPFTWTANGSTAALLLIVAGVAVGRQVGAGLQVGGGRQVDARRSAPAGSASGSLPRLGWRATGAWAVVAAALLAIELVSLFASPRRAHPTISWILAPLSTSTGGRAVELAVLVLVGWWCTR